MCRVVTFQTCVALYTLRSQYAPSAICKVGSFLHESALTICKIEKTIGKGMEKTETCSFLLLQDFWERVRATLWGYSVCFGVCCFSLKVLCFYLYQECKCLATEGYMTVAKCAHTE